MKYLIVYVSISAYFMISQFQFRYGCGVKIIMNCVFTICLTCKKPFYYSTSKRSGNLGEIVLILLIYIFVSPVKNTHIFFHIQSFPQWLSILSRLIRFLKKLFVIPHTALLTKLFLFISVRSLLLCTYSEKFIRKAHSTSNTGLLTTFLVILKFILEYIRLKSMKRIAHAAIINKKSIVLLCKTRFIKIEIRQAILNKHSYMVWFVQTVVILHIVHYYCQPVPSPLLAIYTIFAIFWNYLFLIVLGIWRNSVTTHSHGGHL